MNIDVLENDLAFLQDEKTRLTKEINKEFPLYMIVFAIGLYFVLYIFFRINIVLNISFSLLIIGGTILRYLRRKKSLRQELEDFKEYLLRYKKDVNNSIQESGRIEERLAELQGNKKEKNSFNEEFVKQQETTNKLFSLIVSIERDFEPFLQDLKVLAYQEDSLDIAMPSSDKVCSLIEDTEEELEESTI